MIETENKSEFELTKYNPYLTSYSESIIGILENNAWDITSLYYKAYCLVCIGLCVKCFLLEMSHHDNSYRQVSNISRALVGN